MSDTLQITSPVLVLIGPTAIGKTALSLELAADFHCEIISMDSMQVYRQMDIGTAKATIEERSLVTHHLIDIVDPDDQYDAARFVRDCLEAIRGITSRGRIPLITGGTGLYLRALIHGLFEEIPVPQSLRDDLQQRLEREGRDLLYRELCQLDPVSGQRIHPNDTQRLLRGLEIYQATGRPWSEHLENQAKSKPPVLFNQLFQIGLRTDRSVLYDRIKTRTNKMMCEAFQQEVESLIEQGYAPALSSMQSIGYRHMVGYLQGEWDFATATSMLIQDTRRYAKRQFTWFNRSRDIHWYDVAQPARVMADVRAFLNQAVSPSKLTT